jgi:hypothetical protein
MNFSSGKPSLAQLKLHTRAYYARIGVVRCPILNDDIYFTAEGYNHLINESNSKPGKSKPRLPTEQYKKLMCLMHAKAVLKYSKQVTETRTVRKKVKDEWKEAIQSEVVCEIKGEKISVIVEKVGDGHLKFMSILSDYKGKAKDTR